MPRWLTLALTTVLGVALPVLVPADDLPVPAAKPRYAGPTEKGFLLPNGWTITPVGDQVPLNDLVLNITPTPDGRHALVTSNGFNMHQISLVDLKTRTVAFRQAVRQSWFGLAHDPRDGKVWWAGGGNGELHQYQLKGAELTRVSGKETTDVPKTRKTFKSGLCLDSGKNRLYSLDIDAGTIAAIDLAGGKTTEAPAGARPYDVVLARNGLLYVSDWAGRAVLVIQPDELRVVARIPVGEHPNQLVVHPKDDRVFVTCSSSNSVSVIDTKKGVVTETIITSLFPNAPEGSTPDALALAHDGKTLFVANADNNCVAVIDVEEANESQVKGFIPTGWYPTAVAVSVDGKFLLVGVGKGNQTKPNPIEKPKANDPAAKDDPVTGLRKRIMPYPYIGTTLSGSLSIIAMPDEAKLREYTATVYRNCPYSDKLLTGTPSPRKTAIPTKLGDKSPIEHVIYVIKENRTYDQVLGDMKRGNGDPSLVMFGEQVTPNHHKLAEEYVLLDNLYCNGQVSRDGHPWSTMAYNTDYIARDWMLTYSGRAGVDDDDEGNLQKAPSGYIWDACARNGRSYRNYGEYGRRVSEPDGSMRIEGAVPGLVGHMCPDFGITRNGKRMRDPENVEVFLREFREFETAGKLPNLMILSLGEDHTVGTTPGGLTPQACVASNDQAIGKLVDAVSRSKSWPKIAIFMIEDDAQNGPDHVDAHRTVGLVVSPYTRRKHLDSNQYTTASMLRTIELILGLPPLSQYDAAANPMYESFTDTADLAPYEVVPPKIDLEAKNTPLAYGADRSSKMDFSEYDRIDDFELNEILWRSIKGADAPLPPAVRRAIAYRVPPRSGDGRK